MFSGIEAASVAWHALGFEPVAFAEIEPFPSAVLAHHWPHVPNLGDMTKVDWAAYHGKVDIVIGGPPCQAFSVAGLRKSLEDERGNLSLEYVKAVHAIKPRFVVTENVPGWLSTGDNAFGCFLAGMVGADAPLNSPLERGRWTDAGFASGPLGACAWRILNAQYFGVAQRRRRVFVITDFGARPDPCAVLFERKGGGRHSSPGREEGQGITGTLAARTRGGGGLGTDAECDGALIPSISRPLMSGSSSESTHGKKNGTDRETLIPEIAGCLKERDSKGADSDTTPGHLIPAISPTIGRESYSPTKSSSGQMAGFCIPAVSHPLKAEGADASEDGTGRGTPIVPVYEKAVSATGRQGDRVVGSGDVSPTIPAGGANNGGGGGVLVHHSEPVGFPWQSGFGASAGASAGTAPTLTKNQTQAVQQSTSVRRLIPVECERLQGFPDNHTRIPWRGKPAEQCPDGPRYKALGNSMAVPVIRWIGERIASCQK